MTHGVKAAIAGTVLFAVVGIGGELLYLHYERNAPAKVAEAPDYGPTDPDDLVFLKRERPSSMADLKDLYGKPLWVAAGGQMDYYASTGKHADYSKAAGTLLGAEGLLGAGNREWEYEVEWGTSNRVGWSVSDGPFWCVQGRD